MYVNFQIFLGAVVHAATASGHDVFTVLPSVAELESIVECLDDCDDTEAETLLPPHVCQSRKRPAPSPLSTSETKVPNKIHRTRSRGKLGKQWTTKMDAKDPLGVLFGEDDGSTSE